MSTKAKKSNEIQVGKQITDRGRQSKRFYTEPVLAESGREIFYFRQAGDYLKGILIGRTEKLFLYYSNRTYLIQVHEGRQEGVNFIVQDEDRIEEIIAYRDLRRIIEQNDLMHSVVRIVMIGKVRTHAGHFRFVWEVYKETGTFRSAEVRQSVKPKRKRQKKGVK